MMPKPLSSQSGIVLVSVLIVVALISTSVVLMLKYQNMITNDIKIVNWQANAVQYLFSLEEFYIDQLKDYDKDESIKAKEEKHLYSNRNRRYWDEPISLPIDNGHFEGKLFDLQKGLNLNNIFAFSKGSNQLRAKTDPDFFGCFNLLNLSLSNDTNGNNVVNYLNGNRLQEIKHLSELRKMTFGSNDYQKIKNFLFVLTDKDIKININTASDTILRCLHYGLFDFPEAVQEIKEGRPYKNVDEIKNLGLIPEEVFNQIKPMIDVKSNYFMLKGKITTGNLILNTVSIFRRNSSKIDIINRRYYLNNLNNESN